MHDPVPVREGLYDEVDGGRLIANQCKSCGMIYFPKAAFCFDCMEEEMTDRVLGRRGILYSYAVGRMASTHFKPPYAIGLIDLPEGIRVFAPLETAPDDTYRIGMEMEVFIDELWREEGKAVMGYKFRPVSSQRRME